jgi:hypothetical protein
MVAARSTKHMQAPATSYGSNSASARSGASTAPRAAPQVSADDWGSGNDGWEEVWPSSLRLVVTDEVQSAPKGADAPIGRVLFMGTGSWLSSPPDAGAGACEQEREANVCKPAEPSASIRQLSPAQN